MQDPRLALLTGRVTWRSCVCSGQGLIHSPSLSRVRVRGQFQGGVEMALLVGPQGRGRAARPAQALGWPCGGGTGSRVMNSRDGAGRGRRGLRESVRRHPKGPPRWVLRPPPARLGGGTMLTCPAR